MMQSDYASFLASKAQLGTNDGFEPLFMPSGLFDFQAHLVDWAITKGRSALFEDCGLGKTFQYLVWAENVVRFTNRPVIVCTPLAVSHQTVREAEKFGIEAHLSIDGTIRPGINVVNYERLHYFNPGDFAGAVCDESAILKSFDGVRRAEISTFMRKLPYRLLCTATPSPNEYIELGTSSEALGYLGYVDMLSKFFKNNQGNSIKPSIYKHKGRSFNALDDDAKWRFKGHAEVPFWRWVCSWARAVRKPSDIGFSDDAFILPALIERQHLVTSERAPEGMLFALPAHGLKEQREERRRTIEDRCEAAASLVNLTGNAAAIWCDLNDEGDLIEKLVPDAVQVSGADSDDQKEAKFVAFIEGNERVLITKKKIGAWGLNFQHCHHTVSFPSHSYEQYYQMVRRFWRFGQKNEVFSDIVTTEGNKEILKNQNRKATAANHMFSELVRNMSDEMTVARPVTKFQEVELPPWLH